MLRELMEERSTLSKRKIKRLEAAIASKVDAVQTLGPAGHSEYRNRSRSLPWTFIAELGSDMTRSSPAPKHAASWAGLCPGNHESGGKRLSNRTRKGNRWLRRAPSQAARAATRKEFYPATFDIARCVNWKP